MALASKPDFKAIEAKWQKFWLDKKIFKFDQKSKEDIFAIDTPPPTVSGEMHIGHAVSYTHFDVMGHYKRQKGFNVLQPIGFDDNGHPTETFIEKVHKIASKNMDKTEFNNIVLKEIPKWEETYKKDLVSLGHGYDWDITYSTISSKSMKLVQTSFLDLYNKGLAYRKEAPTIWCTKCQTALAQADLEDKEKETKLNYLNFKVDKSIIEIATTRPEFLPACVGIFVHPDDKKYKKFVGKTAEVPIFGQHVKIMTDEKVDPNFGTGAVMICTFGDKTDIEWWRKYKLPLRMMLTKDGKLNELAGKYADQKIEEARKNILEELKELNILKKQEPLKQTVSVCWRCPTPAEYIVTKQWFVKLLENKNKFKELGRKIRWHPEYFVKIYENWVENLSEDWLISRQRHFGPPIPAWYCKKCGKEILPDEKDLPINPEKDKPTKKCACGSKEYEPEHDVFDTWMTSSLTPQLVLGWNNKGIPKAFPMTLRPSGRDIIRTWEFYTIVKSWYHFKDLPWTNTLISGMVFDPHGEAMHKSKGNAVAPQVIVEKYGSDAFRYWAVSSVIGEDLWYQERELQHAQKLLIKLWNVAKFVDMWKVKPKKFKPSNVIDSWIDSRLSQVTKKYLESFDNYDPVAAKKELENFFWHEYCDFYLEMIKYRLYGQDKEAKESAEQTLYSTFFKILKMFAPVLVHETEEIYHELFKDKEASIHLTRMPEIGLVDMEAVELGNIAVDMISEIRKYKASKGQGPGAEMEKLTVKHPDAKAEKVLDEVARTARIKHLHIEKGELSVSS